MSFIGKLTQVWLYIHDIALILFGIVLGAVAFYLGTQKVLDIPGINIERM